jgi:hypothetical protein
LAYKPNFGKHEYTHPRLCRRFPATRTSNNNKNPMFILLFLPLLSFFLAGYHLQQWSNNGAGMETTMDQLLENEYVWQFLKIRKIKIFKLIVIFISFNFNINLPFHFSS